MTRRPQGRSVPAVRATATLRTTLAAAAEGAFRDCVEDAAAGGTLRARTLATRRLVAHVLVSLWSRHHLPGVAAAPDAGFAHERDAASMVESIWENLNDRLQPTMPLGAPDWMDRVRLGAAVRRVVTAADAALRTGDVAEVGSVVDTLGELSIVRADTPHVQVGQPARWLDVKELLETEPAARAKWVQTRGGLSKSALRTLSAPLGHARTIGDVVDALSRVTSRRPHVADRGELLVTSSADRRRVGAHYTPLAVAERVVERALAPLLRSPGPGGVLALRVCDPAVGSGVFLHTAAATLTRRMTDDGRRVATTGDAFADVVRQCLCGVDVDPIAAELAALTLGLATLARGAHQAGAPAIAVGNALVSPPSPSPDVTPLDWGDAFAPVFARANPGFDALLGNPPWVAYAGRAAQPLDPALVERFKRDSPAFAGYRTLHGLFVWKTATLLRRGGRLGLVLPTSVADLAGYAPARRAHDALCAVDDDLDDFGDGMFDGVFQPCMALTATRREVDDRGPLERPWPLRRSDLTDADRALLERLDARPKLPPHLFGERGLQTTSNDAALLSGKAGTARTPLREGSDVTEFRRGPPRLFVEAAALGARLRPPRHYEEVAVLIRQTARFPIAQISDGIAFRNSLLAGFSDARWSGPALTAYLNSTVIRWFHYMSHRDARQGMPQLKIGHLRRLPDLDDAFVSELDARASAPAARNAGLHATERHEIEAVVAEGLCLTTAQQARVAEWGAANPLPRARRGAS